MKFSELAAYFERIEATSSRLTMTELLAELFTKTEKDEIGPTCLLLQGRVAPLYEAIEFGVADKFMIRAISRTYGVAESEVVSIFKKTGDLGICAQELCSETFSGHIRRARQASLLEDHTIHTDQTDSLSILGVFHIFEQLAKEQGVGSQEKKIDILVTLLEQSGPLSVRYIARIPLGKLRLGFSDMTILDSFSWMIVGDKSLRSAFEDAYNVRPDIRHLAFLLKEQGIDGIKHMTAREGSPILAALCQRLPTADEMIEKMGTVSAEPKFDGVRTQIHIRKTQTGDFRFVSYSRNLERTERMYPELERIPSDSIHAESVILDSEAVGFDEKSGKIIPFQETVTRKRKHGISDASVSVPLKFFVFDIMFKDGKDLLGLPLSERRKILEQTIKPSHIIGITEQIITDNPQKLRDYHDRQLEKGLEGIVVKKWDSPYEPGRKGFSWVKFKEEEGKTGKLADTLDCVVMGYSLGEGKRSGFGIGAFLVGLRTEEDQFVTVTRIGTGVSDALWKELAERLEKIKSTEKPKRYVEGDKTLTPDHWVTPKMVVEIAADDITVSPLHGAGFALRFPRLVRIRTDKSPEEITTVKEIREMYNMQKSIDRGIHRSF